MALVTVQSTFTHTHTFFILFSSLWVYLSFISAVLYLPANWIFQIVLLQQYESLQCPPSPWSSRTCTMWECFVMESFHANRRVRSLLNLLSSYFSHSYYCVCVCACVCACECVCVCARACARLFHCVASPQTIDTSPGVYFENFLLLNTLMSWEGTIAKSIVTSWNYFMIFSLSI
jgi:hypothetical protein